MEISCQTILPPEDQVINRNRTITTYYAKLYQSKPHLHKWAGMAAFASFHIGEKLKMLNWNTVGIKTISEFSNKNSSINDDFQVIRIINNRIFSQIGIFLIKFNRLEYGTFRNELVEGNKSNIIIQAFDKLNQARTLYDNQVNDSDLVNLIWKANLDILWHEQSLVVQPLFDKLSFIFSGTMTLIASLDYSANHQKTKWSMTPRFITFMVFKGFQVMLKDRKLPDVTNIDHRWYWIMQSLVEKWKKAESKEAKILEEINFLTGLETKHVRLNIIGQ